MKNTCGLITMILVLFLITMACSEKKEEVKPDGPDKPFVGSDLIIVEMEFNPQLQAWQKGTAQVGNKAINYIYSDKEYFNVTGNQQLNYKIKVGTAGTYKFIWHCKVGVGTSPTDNNDTWLKIPDAANFFAQKPNSPILHPKGVCVNNCPNGVGEKGWFKIYSNGTTDWSWRTKTSDKDPHEIYATFNKPGTYTVQISARSANQFLDRFVLYHIDKYTEAEATDLSLAPTE